METQLTLAQRTELAHRAEEYVFKRARAATYAFLVYGRALHTFDVEKHWAYLPDPTKNDGGEIMVPFGSFDKWLRSRKELGYSMARLALQVFRRFVLDLSISVDALAGVDVSKFQDITPEVAKLVDAASSPKELEAARAKALEWVSSGSELSRKDLSELRGELEGWETVVSGKFVAEDMIKALEAEGVTAEDEIFAIVRRRIVRTPQNRR